MVVVSERDVIPIRKEKRNFDPPFGTFAWEVCQNLRAIPGVYVGGERPVAAYYQRDEHPDQPIPRISEIFIAPVDAGDCSPSRQNAFRAQVITALGGYTESVRREKARVVSVQAIVGKRSQEPRIGKRNELFLEFGWFDVPYPESDDRERVTVVILPRVMDANEAAKYYHPENPQRPHHDDIFEKRVGGLIRLRDFQEKIAHGKSLHDSHHMPKIEASNRKISSSNV